MSGPLSKRRGAVVVFLVCIALGLALASILARVAHAPWLNAVLLVVPATLVYAIGSGFSAFYLCRAYPLHARHPLAIAGVMGVAALFAGLLWATLLQFLNSVSLLLELRWLGVNLTPSLLALFFGLGVLLYCLAAAVHYLLLEFVRARMAEQRGLEAQLMAQEAQLRMLRTQIDPHFLFNSLNSISALTSIDAAGARQMTVQLASFFRQSLSLEAHKHITVQRGTGADPPLPGHRASAFRRTPASGGKHRHCRAGVPVAAHADTAAGGKCRQAWYLRLDGGRPDRHRGAARGQPAADRRAQPGRCGSGAGRAGNGVGLENVRQRLAGAYGHEASVHWARRGNGV